MEKTKKRTAGTEPANQNSRLLILWDVLSRETDMKHPLSLDKLHALLANLGSDMTDKSLRDMLATLNSLPGHNVLSDMQGHKKVYYADATALGTPEMKLLIDAVQACTCIPEEKTQEIINDLLSTASRPAAEELRQEMVIFNPHKHRNNSVISNIDWLSMARRNSVLVTFRYFYLDENHSPVYQREPVSKPGEAPYTVEPLELVYRDDRYYLIAWDCERARLSQFRLDRMANVQLTCQPAAYREKLQDGQIGEAAHQMIGMYSGEKTQITLRLRDLKAIGVLFDQFGEDVPVRRLGENAWEATLTVQQSPKLWGWLCSSRDILSLAGPEPVRKNYRAWLMQALADTQ